MLSCNIVNNAKTYRDQINVNISNEKRCYKLKCTLNEFYQYAITMKLTVRNFSF